MNIRHQLARTMFRPDLEVLDLVIDITGEVEPDPTPDVQTSDNLDLAEEIANTFNRLRHGTSE